jgi:hypothetical protein
MGERLSRLANLERMMKRKTIIVLIAALGFMLLAALLVFLQPPLPQQSVSFKVNSIVSSNSFPRKYDLRALIRPGLTETSFVYVLSAIVNSNGWSRLCNVTVSNCSTSTLFISGGGSTLWFRINYLTNDVWREYYTRTVDGGAGLMPPHFVITNAFEIPDGASAFKIGLPIIFCTWRTMAAWKYPLPISISEFLADQDRDRRSKVEWSPVYQISVSNELNAH